jgi:adhesin/invasin
VNFPGRPATAGSEIAVFLTGLGPVEPVVGTGAAAPASLLSTTKSAVSAFIGYMPAPVKFAGLAPGFAGLYQVNLIVPQLPGGQYSLQVSIGGVSSNAAGIDVR